MNALSRRGFLGMSAAGTLAGLPGFQSQVRAEQPNRETVSFRHDGLVLSPAEYSTLLSKLAKEGKAEPDVYLEGGCVADLEKQFARTLGKEAALFLPTGTMANHLAIRVLTAAKSRVLVQAESHIYRDSLDCVQTLSHLNLVPLAAAKATIPLAEIEEAHRQASNSPFPIRVGTISIECPVRRKTGEAFEFAEMKKIAAYARKNEIKMHLDGARLFIASAFTGIAPAEYAALFDTVYISLYKYFAAGTGAVLAGPRSVIEQVAHYRKLFGGGMLHAWPYAAVALHFLNGFSERYQKAVANAKAMLEQLEKHPRFRVERIPNGTNIVKLHVKEVDGARYRESLQSKGVEIDGSGSGEFTLRINESANRRSGDELAKAFMESLKN